MLILILYGLTIWFAMIAYASTLGAQIVDVETQKAEAPTHFCTRASILFPRVVGQLFCEAHF